MYMQIGDKMNNFKCKKYLHSKCIDRNAARVYTCC